MVVKIENMLREVSRLLEIQSSIFWLITSFLMPLFMLNLLCQVNKRFLFDLVYKIWVVYFMEVKFYLGLNFCRLYTSVRFKCPLYRGNFYKDLIRKRPRLNFLSALTSYPFLSMSALTGFTVFLKIFPVHYIDSLCQ